MAKLRPHHFELAFAILLLMVKPSASKLKHRKGYRRGLLILILIGVGMYLIVPQVTGLGGSWSALREAQPGWLMVAIGCLLLTYPLAAAIYQCLSMKPLPYGRTTLLQMASMFAGRLLPAGVGALGVNFLYLRRQQHGAAQAGAVVTANNTVGFIGNVVLVAGLLVLTDTALPRLHLPRIGLWLAVALLAILAGLFTARKTRLVRKLGATVTSVGTALASYRRRPLRLLLALLFSILLTTTYGLLLYASARAIGPELSFGAAVIVMTVGVAGATATPTPGGIGGAEAALAAALALYHIPTVDAVAIAVLYRLVTYWLGLILGGVALVVVERRRYI